MYIYNKHITLKTKYNESYLCLYDPANKLNLSLKNSYDKSNFKHIAPIARSANIIFESIFVKMNFKSKCGHSIFILNINQKNIGQHFHFQKCEIHIFTIAVFYNS